MGDADSRGERGPAPNTVGFRSSPGCSSWEVGEVANISVRSVFGVFVCSGGEESIKSKHASNRSMASFFVSSGLKSGVGVVSTTAVVGGSVDGVSTVAAGTGSLISVGVDGSGSGVSIFRSISEVFDVEELGGGGVSKVESAGIVVGGGSIESVPAGSGVTGVASSAARTLSAVFAEMESRPPRSSPAASP